MQILKHVGIAALRIAIAFALVVAAVALSSCAHEPKSLDIAKMSCGAAAQATLYAAARTGCPRVRVERADVIVRSSGKPWLVVKLNVCGEKRVYEKLVNEKWKDVTWKLK
jgi:hypothetical protein